MTAPERLRLELAARRAAGVDFDDAWDAALRCAMRGERDRRWRWALAGTKAGRARAYVGAPQTPAEQALERAFGATVSYERGMAAA